MRICQQCGGKIPDDKRATAKFCSDGCKQEDFRQRKGIARPDFLSTSKPMEATNQQRAVLTEAQKHEQRVLKMEIDNLQLHYEDLLMEYKEIHAAIEQYRRKKTLPEKYLRHYENNKEYIPKEPSKPSPRHVPYKIEPSKPTNLIIYPTREKYEAEQKKRFTTKKLKYETTTIKSKILGRPITGTKAVGYEDVFDEESFNKAMVRYDLEKKEYEEKLSGYEYRQIHSKKDSDNEYKEALTYYELSHEVWEAYKNVKKADKGTSLGIILLKDKYANIKHEIDDYIARINEKKDTIRNFFGLDDESGSGASGANTTNDHRITGADVLEMNFPTYKFSKEWADLLGIPSKPFSMMVFGDAKSGKSYFCLSLAQYLTTFGSVAYFVVEEGIGETMRRKIETTGADDVFILPSQNIDDIISVLKTHKY
ncbi:MAG: hypothetical protein Q8K92_27135, partial [Leadbetterella sp.]|nr:hypothetical protein [Leadbetterella sp.]